jgi:phospholipid/cholesterol/gamma-HCH transport system substrate-binding protein
LTISKEVKTGALVIIGLVLIIFTFNYLKGQNLLDSSRKFYAVFEDVGGLGGSAPVTINGLTVGKVQNIGFMDDANGSLKVTMILDNDFQFSKNSKAEIYETGLIGGKAIGIIPANDNAEVAKSGDQLTSSVKKGMLESLDVATIQQKIEGVMVSADSLMTNINDVFDAKTKANLKNGIAELNSTITSFKHTSRSLNELITSNQEKLDSTLTNFSNISGNLSKITDSVAEADLAQVIKNLESTIGNFDKILTSISNGEGSMGKLLKDEGLYNNIEGATKEMKELLRDIKLHPKRYFRILSKKEIPYEND